MIQHEIVKTLSANDPVVLSYLLIIIFVITIVSCGYILFLVVRTTSEMKNSVRNRDAILIYIEKEIIYANSARSDELHGS